MEFFKNTKLKGESIQRTDSTGTVITSLTDYISMNLSKFYEYVDDCDENWFHNIRIEYNKTLEGISNEIYQNPNYWDLIMLVNKKSPFNCLPYDEETIKDMAISKTNRYKESTYGHNLPASDYVRLYDYYLNELSIENDSRFIIKVIKPSFIQEFLQDGYERGVI